MPSREPFSLQPQAGAGPPPADKPDPDGDGDPTHPADEGNRSRALRFAQPSDTQEPRSSKPPRPEPLPTLPPGESERRRGITVVTQPGRATRDQRGQWRVDLTSEPPPAPRAAGGRTAVPGPVKKSGPAAKTAAAGRPTDPPLVEQTTRQPVSRPAGNPRRRSRAALLVAAAVVALVASVGTLAVTGLMRGGDDDAAPGATSPGRASPTVPAAFDPPVVVPDDGSYSTSELLGSDDLRVTEWIRSREPVGALRLSVPDVPGLSRGGVFATSLSVMADGGTVPVPSVIGTKGITVDLGEARVVELSYVLSGVLEKGSGGSRRALARIIGLDVDYDAAANDAVTAVHAVTGANVLSLACTPRGADATPTACGAPVYGVWQVSLEGRRAGDRVQAQLEAAQT